MTPLLAQRLRTDRSFERLYRRHVADVYHYALAVCRNPADAEDVTQTTFMNAYRAVQAGEQPRTPKNWLLAIAHNVMRQRFRASSRRPNEVELADDVAAAIPDDAGYTAADIRRGLSELAFNQRAALVMRELEGRSYAEIAEILGLSVGAVETLIFRARRALREQLEESLTCTEAEHAISRQLDGRLSRTEKGALRAHLRTCADCASFARSQRAQRTALKGLAAIPLPASLTSLFGGGGAAVGTTVAAKAAAVTALGLLVAGGTVETAHHVRHHAQRQVAAPPAAKSKDVQRASTAAAPVAPPQVHETVKPSRPVVAHKLVSPNRPHVRHAHARKSPSLPATAAPAAGAAVSRGTLPPTSNGSRGVRAHGAPAGQHPATPASTPVLSTPAGNAHAHVHTLPAQSQATTHGRAVGRPVSPGRGHANGRANQVVPPVDETTPAVPPTDTVSVSTSEP